MDDMTKPTDPYSRQYWRFIDEFPSIYENDAAYALWSRLLISGDMAWPASASLPIGTKARALEFLTDAGLVTRQPGGRFRIPSMDKERQARSDAGKAAVNYRWDTTRNTGGNTDGIPSQQSQQSQVKQSQQRGPDAFDIYQQVTGSWPSQKVTPWLSQLIDDYDEAEVCDALIVVTDQDPTRATLMSRVKDRLAADAHRRSRESEESRARSEAEYQRREQERVAENPEAMAAAKARFQAEVLPALGSIAKGMS